MSSDEVTIVGRVGEGTLGALEVLGSDIELQKFLRCRGSITSSIKAIERKLHKQNSFG